MARTKREQELIGRFLKSYNEDRISNYEIAEYPDADNSAAPAIDAVANDPVAGALAIEHTIVQPFVGEKEDSAILLQSIALLEKQPHLVLPGYDVTLTIDVGAIPKGPDWKSAAAAVERWYMSNITALPIGRSKWQIPDLTFALEVDIEKERAHGESHFFINRWMPPDSLEAVVETALKKKLPKLVAANASRRLLLLEKDSIVRSPEDYGVAIEHLKPKFPELERVNEAWVINTAGWPAEDYTPVYFVWPRPMARAWRLTRNLAKRGVQIQRRA